MMCIYKDNQSEPLVRRLVTQSMKMGQFIDQVIICKTFIVYIPWETQRVPGVFGLESLKRNHYYAREVNIFSNQDERTTIYNSLDRLCPIPDQKAKKERATLFHGNKIPP